MQFIEQGPDVPEALLRAHEEGRVVFFCGAGISRRAGLPGFCGLVDGIYRTVGTTRSEVEEEAYEEKRYDTVLDLLERRLVGGRHVVREAVASLLVHDLSRDGASDCHAALLELARDRNGSLRLVTTNFDRIFQDLAASSRLPLGCFAAPFLPVPKVGRWNGIVYLHGLLPGSPDPSALNSLVLTSGDFGLAYLTERWAARFAGELFRNYVVCFVGYDIADPVLRYMMDALAADRALGESTPAAYAFGAFMEEHKDRQGRRWKAKGVISILYRTPDEKNHSVLRQTLREWADAWRDGVVGKERIIARYATAPPANSTTDDDFVGRVLWAIADPTGLPAKRFADFEPVPDLKWLETLSNARFVDADLNAFGVRSFGSNDDKLSFSLIKRPAPHTKAPWMALADDGAFGRWDSVMFHLARWLTRHLNDPELALWFAAHGGRLHPQFSQMVESRLESFAKLQRDADTKTLQSILGGAPNAIPRPLMRTVWQLFLTGRMSALKEEQGFFHWANRFRSDGLSATLRMELRELLAPRIVLGPRPAWRPPAERLDEPSRLKDLFDWELTLSTTHARSYLTNLRTSTAWRAALPQLFDDFQQLVRDSLDLLNELGEAGPRSDPTSWHIPLIGENWQNRGLPEWLFLVELLRDAWLAIRVDDEARARKIMFVWQAQSYPVFKRLALYGATYDGMDADGNWAEWLLEDDAWWLWSTETSREALRLLAQRGAALPADKRGSLEAGIINGPLRRKFHPNIEEADWRQRQLVDQAIWLRLAKLASGGALSTDTARAMLDSLQAAYPTWHLEADESDKFSHWTRWAGDPGFVNLATRVRLPRGWRSLAKQLRAAPPQQPFYEDDWDEICKNSFSLAACALCALARDGYWPADRWNAALQSWGDGPLLALSWIHLAPLLYSAPGDKLLDFDFGLTWWLEAVAKRLDTRDSETVFFGLCSRLLDATREELEPAQNAIQRAINHPVGHIAQALLFHWFRAQPADGQGLPADLKRLLTRMCDRYSIGFINARVLLTANSIALFRVDPGWASENLLPLFRWQASEIEARAAWQGFLWQARLYVPLLRALKEDLLNTVGHFNELGALSLNFARLLTFVAMESADMFSSQELREAFAALPQNGLEDAAQAISEALDSSTGKQKEYWTNRVSPFWQRAWPKTIDRKSQKLALRLARLAIAAGEAFPAALTTVQDWLLLLPHVDLITGLLYNSGHCTSFPKDALRLLAAVVDDTNSNATRLGDCLKQLVESQPACGGEPEFKRLKTLTQ